MEGKDVEMTVCNLLANLSKRGGEAEEEGLSIVVGSSGGVNSGLLVPGAGKPEARITLGLRQCHGLNKPTASSGICVCTCSSLALSISRIFKVYSPAS